MEEARGLIFRLAQQKCIYLTAQVECDLLPVYFLYINLDHMSCFRRVLCIVIKEYVLYNNVCICIYIWQDRKKLCKINKTIFVKLLNVTESLKSIAGIRLQVKKSLSLVFISPQWLVDSHI